MRIFLAGATGAIGKRLVPLLTSHEVFGTTRFANKAEALRKLGARPVVVDVFDAASLMKEVLAAKPEIVIHQLTDLPPGLDPARMAEAAGRNARIRIEGFLITDYLARLGEFYREMMPLVASGAVTSP